MAYPFAAADVLTAVDLNAMIGAPTQNTQTGTTYTAVLLDAGKTVTLSNASAVTLTIPAQASVSWADNTQLNFLNLGAGTVTITPAAGVTINGTPLTLETSKGGSLVRTASNVWTFIPFSAGGVDNANFTNVATGTYTDGGIDYKYITFTGSGSLVVDRAGFADILCVGGGGGAAGGAGDYGSGGAGGGQVIAQSIYLTAGTYTVTIGAGGAGKTAGSDVDGRPGFTTKVGWLSAYGGGGGGSDGALAPFNGFNSGGAGSNVAGTATAGNGGFTGGAAVSGQTSSQGSGAGASANGANGSDAAGNLAGGAGLTSAITGSSVEYANGGSNGKTSPADGGANTGDGADGRTSGSAAAKSGGSGTVNVRVAV